MLSQAQEELLHVNDVKGGVGVEDDDVFQVGSNAVEALDDLDDDLDEQPWSSDTFLRHYQPLEETRGSGGSSERYRVLMHCYLMTRRDKIQE